MKRARTHQDTIVPDYASASESEEPEDDTIMRSDDGNMNIVYIEPQLTHKQIATITLLFFTPENTGGSINW